MPVRHHALRSSVRLIAAQAALTLVALLAARPALASGPTGTYAVPTRVELFPSEADATRAVIHGAFFQLKTTTTYGDPQCGVMSFECQAGQETMCRMQWSELRTAVTSPVKNFCLGFGALNVVPT